MEADAREETANAVNTAAGFMRPSANTGLPFD